MWLPIWTLPNIDLDAPVESEFFVLAPFSDARVQAMLRGHQEFRKFMGRFTDTFKTRIHPTVILRRDPVSRRLMTSEAAASFRDILVASMVPGARSRNLVHDNARNQVAYSSYFWIFPWMIDRNYKFIMAQTPAIRAVHEAGAFKGQSSPDLSPVLIRRCDFDEPLLGELLQRFRDRYVTRSLGWRDTALFRSLNVANQASLLPGGVDATIHDFGRIIALWVSAFEILVHPGLSGRADLEKVFDLLGSVPWINRRLAAQRYVTGIPKARKRRNLACWVYERMFRCRNNFLHGNPVNHSDLKLPISHRRMDLFAPTLYRLGLTSFLDLSWKVPWPEGADINAEVEYHGKKGDFEAPQRDTEQALRLSRVPLRRQRQEREALINQSRRRMRAAPQ